MFLFYLVFLSCVQGRDDAGKRHHLYLRGCRISIFSEIYFSHAFLQNRGDQWKNMTFFHYMFVLFFGLSLFPCFFGFTLVLCFSCFVLVFWSYVTSLHIFFTSFLLQWLLNWLARWKFLCYILCPYDLVLSICDISLCLFSWPDCQIRFSVLFVFIPMGARCSKLGFCWWPSNLKSNIAYSSDFGNS